MPADIVSENDWSPNIITEQNGLFYIAIYTIILFVVSIASNSSLIWILVKNKKLLQRANILILALTILNLLGTLIELPIVTITVLNKQFLFGKFGCFFEAFTAYFVGCGSINLLTSISYLRYSRMYESYKTKRKIRRHKEVIAMIFSLFSSLFWALMPFFGWSEYSLEGIMISCSVEWEKKTLSVISYNVTILILVYAAPIIVITFTNLKIISFLRKSNVILRSSIVKNFEFKTTILTIILLMGIVVSWTPYAFVCIYRIFRDNSNEINPWLATIPGFFAKFSLAWPALLILFGNSDITKHLCFHEEYPKKQSNRYLIASRKQLLT